MKSLIPLVPALLMTGCSLVYDADDFRAGRDGGPTPDADPDALQIVQLFPDRVFEGEGDALDPDDVASVRPVPLVIEGRNMTADTVFTLDGPGYDMEVVAAQVSADGTLAALTLRVPILPDVAIDEASQLAVRIDKGEESDTELLVIDGLDGLELDGGTIDTDDAAFSGRYSHVALTGTVTSTGQAPLRLLATAGISIDGSLSADGVGQTAGPGGCDGGASSADASCGVGSGKAGDDGTTDPGGGGGGGYGAADATSGTGGGGEAGAAAGNAFLVPLPPAEDASARGAGGGGGGKSTGVGGALGGGSGGVIELRTPALIVLGDASEVHANGASGGNSGACATGGGGGGGGSGGAVLIRVATAMNIGGVASLAAVGGDGGGPGGCAGGNGGVGRIRVDSPGPTAPTSEPAAVRGPVIIAAELDPIVTEADVPVPVRGAAQSQYQLLVAGESQAVVSTDDAGLGTQSVTLEPGLNQLCVRVSPAADLSHPESTNCLSIAYIELP